MSRIESNDVVLAIGDQDVYDLQIDSEGDILTADFMDTSIFRSIYAEKRALPNEILVPELRRGWIGNQYLEQEDGSKTWLYEQAPLNRDTINGVKSAIENGLKWLTEYDAAIEYDVSVSYDAGSESMAASVTIQRSSDKTETYYYNLFQNSGVM